MKKFLKRLMLDIRGTSAVEYGIMLALIVLAMLSALNGFAGSASSMWDDVSTKSKAAMGGNT